MKLLITGCCGHIGSYITDNVFKIKRIKKTIIIDDLKYQNYQSLFKSKKKNNLIFFNRDISKKNSLDDIKNLDYVIHCASITNAEKSFDNKNEMYQNNLGCLRNIIKLCERTKARLIHISSTSVYGKNTKIVDEQCEEKYLIPQSPYADIKLLEEKILKKNKKKIKFNTYRFGTIAGISKGIRFHTAVNKFCLNAALNQNINVYQTALHQYRPYLSLKDAFKVFKFTIERNFFKNDVYNVVSANHTVDQILNKIRKNIKNIKIKFVKTKIMNKLSYMVSNEKIKKEGFFLSNNINKEIKDTINLFRNIK